MGDGPGTPDLMSPAFNQKKVEQAQSASTITQTETLPSPSIEAQNMLAELREILGKIKITEIGDPNSRQWVNTEAEALLSLSPIQAINSLQTSLNEKGVSRAPRMEICQRLHSSDMPSQVRFQKHLLLD